MLKYLYIFQIKYTEAILSNSTRKLLRFDISKMPIAVKKNKFIVLFIINFGTLSFPIKLLLLSAGVMRPGAAPPPPVGALTSTDQIVT